MEKWVVDITHLMPTAQPALGISEAESCRPAEAEIKHGGLTLIVRKFFAVFPLSRSQERLCFRTIEHPRGPRHEDITVRIHPLDHQTWQMMNCETVSRGHGILIKIIACGPID